MGKLGITNEGIIVTEEITNIEELPTGNYQWVTPIGQRPFLQRMGDVRQVGDIFFTDSELGLYEDIVKMIRPEVKELMARVRKTFKFNYFFYGPQGGGKGMFVQKIINRLTETWNGPVLVFSQGIDRVLSIDRFLRTHFGDNHNILTIFVEDECEKYMYEFKQILDSHISPNNMVTFWITNKVDKIDETVYVDRPSRIAKHFEFKYLTKKEAKLFIEFLLDDYKKQGFMDVLKDVDEKELMKKFDDKSKDFISSELLMSMLLQEIAKLD